MSELQASRPVQILESAHERGRLPHGILLFGESLDGLQIVVSGLAQKLLETEKDPIKHPDFFTLRPANKMRQIGADETRAVITQIQQTANQGGRKVAVVYEADRMNKAAANAFLKTLEEPPADTTIFLLTIRPYNLLATIRSRCMNLRLPAGLDKLDQPEWLELLEDYKTWLGSVSKARDKGAITDLIIGLYGIVARFTSTLKSMSDEAWSEEKQSLPDSLTDEQKDALETGMRKGLRTRLLNELQHATRDYAFSNLDSVPAKELARAIADLERSAGLLEVNLKDDTALELFMLRSLRIWTGR